MRYPRRDPGHDRIATLDIETTHYRPEKGEIVSIGIGVHDRGEPGAEATYDTFHRDGSGEATVVRRALNRLTEYDADGLVTYNGIGFDVAFIEARLERSDEPIDPPELTTASERHIDLYADRKQRADREGSKWPSLEECLETYGYPRPSTEWNGEAITNTRFGEEIGPAYLNSLAEGSRQTSKLRDAIEHYLTTDLEANVALYYADIGLEFEPYLLGSERSF